jgi:hypothetical protein
VVIGFTFAAARIWWITTIVPGMDYPQFLLFVRALQDYTDPSSPFHGTYIPGPWFMPTSLPVNFTSVLSHLCGGSIEAGGKLLLTLQNVSLVGLTMALLKALGRNRWGVLLLFPVIHSSWTVVGGFAAYATSLPFNVLAWALTLAWLYRVGRQGGAVAPTLRWGIALALCLCVNLFWHGIGFVQAGLGFAVLWALWRAPSWRARCLSVTPTLPCLVLFAVWQATTFGDKAARGNPPEWAPFWGASESIFDYMWATVPHYATRTLVLFVIVGGGLLLSPKTLGASGPTSKMWRVSNPFLVLSLAYLASYYAFPLYMDRVEGVSSRFPYVSLIAFIFAWNLPHARVARAVALAAVGGYAVFCLQDITERFRAFNEDTQGASDLMDQIALHDTLYYSPPGQGVSKDFDGPTNKPMRELEQYASIRRGGLPNSSFAGYGYTYIRYVNGQNPMPGLFGMGWNPQMTKFDYVLTRAGSGPNEKLHYKLVSRVKGWELYGVCGSKRFPSCA